MERKVNFVLVGVLVVALGAALVAIILWLGKGDYTATYDRYHVYMRESVAGLNVNAPVKYHGVEVGYVSEIRLNPDDPSEVQLTLAIEQDVPIKQDTRALLHVQGLTGFAIIDLTGGSPGALPLTARPGQPYPVIETVPSFFARLDRAGVQLINNLNRVLEDARGLVSEENQAALKALLTDLSSVTQALAGQTDRVAVGVTSAAEAAEHLARLGRTLNERLPGLLTRVDRSMAAVQRMTQEVSQTSDALGTVVRDTRPEVERFSRETLAETDQLVAELRHLTANLTRFSQQIERNPQALVFGRVPPPPGPGE